MTHSTGKYSIPLVLAGLVLRFCANGQTQDESPSGLIKFLTYQSGRLRGAEQNDRFDCRIETEGRQDRAAYEVLLSLRTKAIPAIEQYLDSLQRADRETAYALGYNSKWVLYAYAKIEGAAAFPRLRQMVGDAKLFSLRLSLDDSLALALDLTSYLSRFYPATGILRCHSRQPRDGLNQMILAWEQDDRSLLEASLGQQAKTALNSLLEGRTWAGLRAELLPATSGGDFALGYRFEVPSVWSVPEAGIEDLMDVASENGPELETRFKSRSGGDCGTYRIKFLRVPAVQPGGAPYLVDNADLGDLLRLIGSCAAQ
jgi:hypothetical protein